MHTRAKIFGDNAIGMRGIIIRGTGMGGIIAQGRLPLLFLLNLGLKFGSTKGRLGDGRTHARPRHIARLGYLLLGFDRKR